MYNQLPQVLKHYPVSTLCFDQSTFVITGANETLVQLSGYSENDLLGLPIHSLVQSFPSANASILTSLITAQGGQLPVKISYSQMPFENSTIQVAAIELQNPEILRPLTSPDEFRKAITSSSIVSMADRAGTITYVNSKFVAISGYSASELVGQNHRIINSAYHPHEFWEDMWKTISVGKNWRAEVKNRAKNGSFYWVDTFVMPFLDDHFKVRGFLSIRNDITARKIAEESLTKVNQRLSDTLKFARMGSIEINLSSKETVVSPELLALLAVKTNEPTTFPLDEFIDLFILKPDGHLIRELLAYVNNGEETGKRNAFLTLRMISNDQQIITMDARFSYENEKAVVIIHDISEKERTHHALITKSQQVENILNSITDGFYALDSEWNFIIANTNTLKLFGRKQEEVIGKNFLEVFPEAKKTIVYQKLQDAVASAKSINFEADSQLTQGRVYEINAYPHQQGLFVYFRDITDTKKAVHEMLRSQEQLQTIVDNIPMDVFMKDLSGQYVFYNNSFKKFLPKQPTLGFRDGDIFEEELTMRLRGVDQKILSSGETTESEYDIEINGKTESFFAINFPLFDAMKEIYAIGGVLLQITDRKKMEKDLRESEERMRLAQEAANLGIWEWNLKSNQIVWNAKMYDIFGVDQGIPRSIERWREMIHPEDLERAMEDLDQALKGIQSYQSEYRIIRSDGSIRFLTNYGVVQRDKNSEPIRMIGVDWDVTSRKLAVAEQIRLNKLVEESFNEIFIIHDPSLKLEYANPAALQNLGYDQWDLTNLKLTDLFKHPDEMAINALLNSLRKSVTDRLQLQLKFTRNNGTQYDADVLIQVLEKDHSFMAIVTDITAKLVTEKKLLETITEKETLIKEIHHRVKNNLQLISSIIFLKVVSLGESDIKSFLEDTRQKIRSIALIHERLLQTQTLDRVEISDYLGKLINDLQMTYQRPDLHLKISSSIQSHTIHLDVAIICGLIVNELITNALKHAFKGRSSGEMQINFLYDENTGKHFLSIEDNGVSLPMHIQPGASTSFGMQLIDVFVKQLNGQYEIVRENGTKFQIRF